MAKIIKGSVVKLSSEKTIIVKVETLKAHPLYKKILKKNSHYHVHYEGNKLKIGDIVKIREVRPISKTKHWIVLTDSK